MSMIHDITAVLPRYKRGTRKGRGESSGHGKTAGRGTKGAGARQGGPHWKAGHEGGQTPLHRRLPARGFSNHDFAKTWYIVNISDLERFADGATVDAAALIEAGLVRDSRYPVKVLGDGKLSKKLTVIAGWYTKSAVEKITTIGGTVQNLKSEPFAFPKPKKIFVPREPVKKPKLADQPAAEASKAESPKAEEKKEG